MVLVADEFEVLRLVLQQGSGNMVQDWACFVLGRFVPDLDCSFAVGLQIVLDWVDGVVAVVVVVAGL